MRGIRNRKGSGDVSSDEIALHRVLEGASAQEHDAGGVVARDDIARRFGRATDSITRSVLYYHAIQAVAKANCASEVGADEIALHKVARGIDVVYGDTVLVVARKQIARARLCSSQDIVGAIQNTHTAAPVR